VCYNQNEKRLKFYIEITFLADLYQFKQGGLLIMNQCVHLLSIGAGLSFAVGTSINGNGCL